MSNLTQNDTDSTIVRQSPEIQAPAPASSPSPETARPQPRWRRAGPGFACLIRDADDGAQHEQTAIVWHWPKTPARAPVLHAPAVRRHAAAGRSPVLGNRQDTRTVTHPALRKRSCRRPFRHRHNSLARDGPDAPSSCSADSSKPQRATVAVRSHLRRQASVSEPLHRPAPFARPD